MSGRVGTRVSLGLTEIGFPVHGGDAIVLEMFAGKAANIIAADEY